MMIGKVIWGCENRNLLAVKSTANVFGMNFHFASKKGKNVTAAINWELLKRHSYAFRRYIRRNDHIFHVLTRVVVIDSKSL